MSTDFPTPAAVVKSARTYLRDLGERVLTSFVGGAVAAALAAGPLGLLHASAWQSVAVGGLAAVVSLLKGLAAKGVGDKHSASSAPGV
jgi:hypothetical protein